MRYHFIMKIIKSGYQTAMLFFIALILLSFKCGTAATTSPQAKSAQGVSTFFTEQQFNDFFPLRDKFYTYQAFMQAVKEIGYIKLKVEKREVSIYKVTR